MAVAYQLKFWCQSQGYMASLWLHLLSPRIQLSFPCLPLFPYSSAIDPKQFLYLSMVLTAHRGNPTSGTSISWPRSVLWSWHSHYTPCFHIESPLFHTGKDRARDHVQHTQDLSVLHHLSPQTPSTPLKSVPQRGAHSYFRNRGMFLDPKRKKIVLEIKCSFNNWH